MHCLRKTDVGRVRGAHISCKSGSEKKTSWIPESLNGIKNAKYWNIYAVQSKSHNILCFSPERSQRMWCHKTRLYSSISSSTGHWLAQLVKHWAAIHWPYGSIPVSGSVTWNFLFSCFDHLQICWFFSTRHLLVLRWNLHICSSTHPEPGAVEL